MPDTMLAARYDGPGPAAEVLRVEEVALPVPGPGEVRVRLAVAGVNPTDVKARAGATPPAGEGPWTPGQDGAGTIDAVGDGVDAARVGERVWVYFAARGRPWGTAAQATLVPAVQAVALPDAASFDLGASLGIPAVTAQHCLFADGSLEGRAVLIAGGAGAVGHHAIELARRGGARVIATASTPDKAELARAAGADAVVDYRAPDAAGQVRAAAPDGVDRVVELDLAANLALDLAACAPHATIVTYATGPEAPELPVRDLMTPNITLRFVLVYTIPADALAAAVAGVSGAVADGALSTLPLHRFALADVAAAHEAVEGGATGKVLLDVQ